MHSRLIISPVCLVGRFSVRQASGTLHEPDYIVCSHYKCIFIPIFIIYYIFVYDVKVILSLIIAAVSKQVEMHLILFMILLILDSLDS